MEDETQECSSSTLINEENEDSDDWDEMETTNEQTQCLFCPLQFLTIAVALDHCRTEHDLDLLELKTKFQMDCYSYIKMINYIRKNKCNAKEIIEAPYALWDSDDYMKPGETETWLMYDFDDLGTAPSTPHYAIDGKTPLSNINYSDLQRKITILESELQEKCILLENAQKDITEMKKVTRALIENTDDKPTTTYLKGDSDYFHSYSHFGIHHEMLNDKIRTESYRNAIILNGESFKDKSVLDVGCGTGILSMFAAQSGANQIYGIDQSDVIYKAMDVIRENKLEDKINLIKEQIENVNLPIDKVDIIISEWMGYFLLFEGMLDSFIYARNKFLKPNGLVLPNRCNISIVGVSDLDSYNKYINFWDNVYGFSMNCIKNEAITEAYVDTVLSEKLITSSEILINIDLLKCDTNTCNFKSNFNLKILNDGILTALVGYFDIFFDLPNTIMFSTSPNDVKTHWQQTVFYLKDCLNVKKGDCLEGTLICSRLKDNVRGLSVTIHLGNKKYQYHMD